MMQTVISKFQVVEGQDWLIPTDPDEFEYFFGLDGTPITAWHYPEFRPIERQESISLYSDFPWFGEHAPLVRRPAVAALGDTLRQYGQLLPLGGEEAWFFNVTVIIDALDREQSEIAYFDDGTILAIEHFEFKPDRLEGVEVFKLPIRASPVFVDARFVERVRQAGLQCVGFDHIWQSAREA